MDAFSQKYNIEDSQSGLLFASRCGVPDEDYNQVVCEVCRTTGRPDYAASWGHAQCMINLLARGTLPDDAGVQDLPTHLLQCALLGNARRLVDLMLNPRAELGVPSHPSIDTCTFIHARVGVRSMPDDTYRRLCANVASRGNVASLRILWKFRAPSLPAPEICAEAAWADSFATFLFAYENGCGWDPATTLNAVTGYSARCLSFAIDHGCPVHPDAPFQAIAMGYKPTLDALTARNVSFNRAFAATLDALIESSARWLEDPGRLDRVLDGLLYVLDGGHIQHYDPLLMLRACYMYPRVAAWCRAKDDTPGQIHPRHVTERYRPT